MATPPSTFATVAIAHLSLDDCQQPLDLDTAWMKQGPEAYPSALESLHIHRPTR